MTQAITKDNHRGKLSHEYYMKVYNEAVANNHTHWIEDAIPVPHNLKRFYEEVKHRTPGLIVRIDRRSSGYNGQGYQVFADIGLGFADAPELPVGQIGLEMDDHRNLLFYVHSNRIENEKFASHSEGYRIKKSKNYATAVKTARQYIKPVTMEDVMFNGVTNLDKAITEIRQPAREKMYNALNIARGDLFDELKYMMQIGYQPKTQKFADTLNTFTNELNELLEVEQYDPVVAMVWLKPDRVEYQIRGEKLGDVALTPQDVPQWIADKLPVLQIAEANSPIKDVGVKVTDTMFWVFK